MSKTNNLLIKEKLKNDIKSNKYKTQKELLIANGYAPSTALHKSGRIKLLKEARAELEEQYRDRVTIDSVLENLDKIKNLALKKKDYATATRIEELKGKSIAMFTDKVQQDGSGPPKTYVINTVSKFPSRKREEAF